MHRTLVIVGTMLFASMAVHAGDPARSPSVSQPAVRVLVFSGTGWYRHPEVAKINGYLVRLGDRHGMRIDVTENGKDLDLGRLKAYDVVLFNNANMLDKILNEKQRAGFEKWFESGGAIVGLHALAVRQQGWPWMLDLNGCDFDSDSEFLKAKVLVDPEAKDHPAVRGHGEAFWYTADWTNHTRSVTGLPGVQVLLRVDESTYDPVRDYFKARGGKAMGMDHPIAWLREYKGGRYFYTELGHDVRSLDTPFGRQHVIEGIRWAARKPAETR